MVDKYLILFEKHKYELESLLPLGNLRIQAIKELKTLGFPNSKMESWKNFDLTEFNKKEYSLFIKPNGVDLNFPDILPEIENNGLLILKNGSSAYKMQLNKYKNGVIFGSLRGASHSFPEIVNKYLNKANKQNLNGFNALNTAFCTNGFFLYVPENIEVELPFAIVNYFKNKSYTMATLRNIVVLGNNAKAKIINFEASDTDDRQFVNNLTEIFLGENSSLELDRLQKYNGKTIVINPVFVNQQENSVFNKTISTLRGYRLRNDIHDNLTGENSKSGINGIYILDEDDMVENRVFLDHSVPNCDSNQLFKGVLDGKSKGAFTGYVLVRQDAQKTNAFQSNKNIIVSDDAKINTNPFLEIYADDVKCSHGASVGNLDTDALFYLRTRGIEEKKARDILLSAFALDALENMENKSFKKLIAKEIEKSLVKV